MSGSTRCASAAVSSGMFEKLTTKGTFRIASATLSAPGSVNARFTPLATISASISPAAIASVSATMSR